jgi:hypothetical protein
LSAGNAANSRFGEIANGCAQAVNNGVNGVENLVAEAPGSQLTLNLLHGVHFRRTGRDVDDRGQRFGGPETLAVPPHALAGHNGPETLGTPTILGLADPAGTRLVLAHQANPGFLACACI